MKIYVRDSEKEHVWDQKNGSQIRNCILFDTDGTNLASILTFLDVDHTRTVSNDITEVLTVGSLLCGFPVAFVL